MTRTLAFVLSASLAACAGGEAEVHYAGEVTTPELVTMDSDPSVMIVANADEPVFYSENTYWLYRDQRWYRSSSHRGGWARADAPSEHIRRIERPTAYVHIRRDVPQQTTLNMRAQPTTRAPEYRGPDRSNVRAPDRVDNRAQPAPPPAAPPPAAPPPAAPPPRPDASRAEPPRPDRLDPASSEPTLRGPGYAPGPQRPSPNAAPVPPPGERTERPGPSAAEPEPAQPRAIEPRSDRDERHDAVVDPTNDPARPSYK